MERSLPAHSLVLVVDVQERLANAMPPATMERLVPNTLALLEAAKILGISTLATEQYPKGLGPTIGPIRDALHQRGIEPIDKLTFDACGEPRVAQAIAAAAPRDVIVVGMETHVCVFQTARELVRRNHRVFVLADAVASRRDDHRTLGLSLSERAGAFVMPTETILFDWLERAGTEAFKAVSKLVR